MDILLNQKKLSQGAKAVYVYSDRDKPLVSFKNKKADRSVINTLLKEKEAWKIKEIGTGS